MKARGSSFAGLVALLLIVLSAPTAAQAEPPPRFLELERREQWQTVGKGAAGFVTGFLAHEAGHVAVNLMLGNVPKFEGFLVWGFLPFFAIAPRIGCAGNVCTKHNGDEFNAGPRGKYAIVSAGYNVQHITDEIVLTRAPNLRYEDAPFRKGLLLFNVFLSCMYAAGDLAGIQDPHGDLAGLTRLSGFHHVALSAALLLPAALDTFRFFMPQHAHWSAWVSRGSKTAFLGLNVAF